MKTYAIDQIGRVYENADGQTVVEGWAFRSLRPEGVRVFETGEGLMEALLGLLEPTDPDDGWTPEELAEIEFQAKVLSLLPTEGDTDG